jgi:hypothetical protein
MGQYPSRIEIVRITEILSWNNEPAEGNRSNPRLNYPPAPFRDDLTNVANAFTRRGAVKHLWNLNGLGAQPSGPAQPNPETEVIPSGTLEPSAASWEAEPVRNRALGGSASARSVPAMKVFRSWG